MTFESELDKLISNKLSSLGLIERELANTVSLKSINEVLREYEDTLERYIVDTTNGNMTAGEMSRAHKALIKRLGPVAYQEGMREGGFKNPEEEMEEEDDEEIDSWVEDQISFVSDFAKEVAEVSSLKGDDKTDARDSMLDRAEHWTDAVKFIGQKGYLSAKGNLMLTFAGDDGEHGCNECKKYEGQSHPKSWWEKRGLLDRPNENFGCGRFETCNHHFEDSDGNVVID